MIKRNLFLGVKTLSNKEFISNFKIWRYSYSTNRQTYTGDLQDIKPLFVKKVWSLLSDRKARSNENQTVLKNSSLVRKAISLGIKISDIVYRKPGTIKDIPSDVVSNINLHRVYRFPREFNLNFENEETEMIALCDIPSTSVDLEVEESAHLPITIIVDNIRNYQNMGVIINVTQHLKCKNLLLTKGCVDIWNPKAIECAMGSHLVDQSFIKENQLWSEIRDLVSKDSKVFIADTYANESNLPFIKSFRYTDADYKTQGGITLILGGECDGLSEEAIKFCGERLGSKIYIPVRKGVDSLNVGTATGILLSEITRQLRANVRSSICF